MTWGEIALAGGMVGLCLGIIGLGVLVGFARANRTCEQHRVTAVNGDCAWDGYCGALLENGEKVVRFQPVVGEIVEVCR